MQTNTTTYDFAIIGAGLAGLALAIQLAQKNHKVLLIEKNTFPFHRVCGEYISMESWDFIKSLGIDLDALNLPKITQLTVTAHNGYAVSAPLQMGGFGVSRYTLDNLLAQQAKKIGVELIENCKATNVNHFENYSMIETSNGAFYAKLVAGSFGKYSPAFMDNHALKKQNNYIAVKYHIKTKIPENVIELHNFKDGYCGISTIDNDTQCVCYLTTSSNLQNNHNDIKLLEKKILQKNPHLKKYFNHSAFLFEKPLVISNISFQAKQAYQNHLFLLGDAAGTIAPLCGNGMSMALRASMILANDVSDYFNEKITKAELIYIYSTKWNNAFNNRIKTGYYLQKIFGKKLSTCFTLYLLSKMPFVFKKIISLTHGKPIINKN